MFHKIFEFIVRFVHVIFPRVWHMHVMIHFFTHTIRAKLENEQSPFFAKSHFRFHIVWYIHITHNNNIYAVTPPQWMSIKRVHNSKYFPSGMSHSSMTAKAFWRFVDRVVLYSTIAAVALHPFLKAHSFKFIRDQDLTQLREEWRV